MSRQSIGSEAPEDQIDADQSGTPDRTELDFESDGRTQPSGSDARTSRPHRGDRAASDEVDADQDNSEDDGGLESSRNQRGTVVPPASN